MRGTVQENAAISLVHVTQCHRKTTFRDVDKGLCLPIGNNDRHGQGL